MSSFLLQQSVKKLWQKYFQTSTCKKNHQNSNTNTILTFIQYISFSVCNLLVKLLEMEKMKDHADFWSKCSTRNVENVIVVIFPSFTWKFGKKIYNNIHSFFFKRNTSYIPGRCLLIDRILVGLRDRFIS